MAEGEGRERADWTSINCRAESSFLNNAFDINEINGFLFKFDFWPGLFVVGCEKRRTR